METRCTRFMPRLGHAAHGWFQSIQDTSRRDPSGRASLGSIEGGGKITRGRPRLNQWLFFFGTFNKRWDRWHRINPPIGSFFSAYILSFWGVYAADPTFYGSPRNNHGLNGVSLDLQEGIRKLFQWGDGFFHQQKNPKKSSHSGLALNKIVLFPTSYGMFVQKHRFLFGHLEYHLRLGFAYRTHSTPKINSSPLNTADQFKRKVYSLSSKHHFWGVKGELLVFRGSKLKATCSWNCWASLRKSASFRLVMTPLQGNHRQAKKRDDSMIIIRDRIWKLDEIRSIDQKKNWIPKLTWNHVHCCELHNIFFSLRIW